MKPAVTSTGGLKGLPLQALKHRTFGEAFRFWLKLGFVSFGGPTGQIAMMDAELVGKVAGFYIRLAAAVVAVVVSATLGALVTAWTTFTKSRDALLARQTH